ncbi:unnamed protein product [Hymenolepis diminuta]|uniref:Uncharacterized protein n=1 Tax=Hymenolepis diminuta TaxID=6216 RepID=A0A564YBT6_HYMDI|nr:unnamed protein product [Hymenolepis diminuta]
MAWMLLSRWSPFMLWVCRMWSRRSWRLLVNTQSHLICYFLLNWRQIQSTLLPLLTLLDIFM